MKLRTDIHAGGNRNPGGPVPPTDGSRVVNYSPYGPSGWFWVPGGYIARPGKPLKSFAGWYYGSAPVFYSAVLEKQTLGGGPGEGVLAPKSP